MTASIHVRVLRKSCGWLKPCCPCCMSNICHFSVLVLFNCQLAGCWINSYISTPDSLSLYRQPCQNTVVCACCCARQGYGLFLYLWQFFIPLVIFVVAYWKILGVVHRQEKVDPGCKRNATTNNEPLAETNMETFAPANADSNRHNSERDENHIEIGTAGSRGHRAVRGQNGPENKPMSRTQINVVRTMIYITACYTVCWMPMYLYHLLSTFRVGRFKFFNCSSLDRPT